MAGVPEGRLTHKAGWGEESMAYVDQFEGVQRAWTPDEMRRVYAEQPDDADRIVFGRRSADRRGFLKGAGLATMGAMLGAAIPFHRNMPRSEEHTSELQSLMRNSYAVFCLHKK